MSLLRIEGLTGGYADVDILNGIDVTVDVGQIVTIAGTNGAGKSTLAKAVVGLLPRVGGRIVLDGADLVDVPAERRAALGIGYVPQVSNVFEPLTILENLEVVEGVAHRRARIEELFAMFPALAERRKSRASSLSGGERQQLAFARALMTRPRLVVLDEPTAALSPSLVDESFHRIASLAKSGTAVLLIEQRARKALAISDVGYILDIGKVAMTAPASALLDNDEAARLYLGQAT